MKRVFLLSALFVMSILAGWAQTEQPTETGFGIIFSDGSTIKGELCAEEGDTAYVLWDQVIAKEQSFKLYDFGTQTAWVTSQHAYLNEHISIQNDSYVPDSTAAYSIAIGKDSLIIALPDDDFNPDGTPAGTQSSWGGTRGGTQLGAVSENGFTFLIWKEYTYFYDKNKSETVSFNEPIAICTACKPRRDIVIPSSVTWNGVKYPVKVIGDCADLRHQYGEDDLERQTLTIPASVEVLEYAPFIKIQRTIRKITIEDSDKRLLCSPSQIGFWEGGRRGVFSKIHHLREAYIGRELKNATTYDWAEPFNYWPFYGKQQGYDYNLSITFGPSVSRLSNNYFGGFFGGGLYLTFEHLGVVSCEGAWPSSGDHSLSMKVYTGFGEKYKVMNFYRQRNEIGINEMPGSGTSGGTTWELVAIGSIKDGTCTGYRMTISRSEKGNGKMEDKDNSWDHRWFAHHKVIHELVIESGVTHLSKLGWDGYPLKAIYVRTQDAKSLPAIGADAFRGVNKKTPVYVHSSIRTILQNQADWKACFEDFRDLDIQDFIKPYVDWIKNVVGNAKDDATKNLAENYIKNANGFVRREQIDAAKIEFLHQLFNQDGDGTITSPYAIATADQLMCFANLTSMDHYLSACGKLTADINAETYGADVMLAKNQERAYMGTLDGQGHSINIGFASVTNAALIGTLGGTVKNLVVTGGLQLATATDANSLGGVVACCFNTATVENCISKVTLTGTTSYNSCGGIVGKTLGRDSIVGTATIRNCAFLGQIIFNNSEAPKGVEYCGGIVGRSEGVTLVSHCYTAATYIGKFSDNCANIAQIGTEGVAPKIERCYYLTALGSPEQGKELDEQQRTTGQWCYMLNDSVSDGAQVWHQKVNEDGYPYPFSRGGDVVYWDNRSYTNSHTKHTFGADGFCTICGAVDPNHQGAYQVSTAGQWKHLAAYVDKDHCKFNVELMKDINLTCIGNAAFFGKNNLANAFKGNFDGHGHSLTVKLVSSEDRVGLFRGTDHATIKNLEVEGNIIASNWYIGGIIGDGFWGTNLQNCISEVNITCTKNGDGSSGGLIGICNKGLIINNCAFTGKMIGNNTSCWGGLVGWVCDGAPTITNSYVYATTENISTDGCCTFARVNNNQYQNIKDCYYVTPLGNTQGGKQVKEAEAKSGYLCYELLNKGVTDGSQAWYQALESNEPEDHPYPFSQGGDTVFYDKIENKYVNTHHHHFNEGGFCTECGAIDPNAKEVTISSAIQMRRWAEWVNAGHGDVSVKLAMDLDYNRDKLFTIGKDITYTGTFDGQGHKMTMPIGEASAPTLWTNFAGKMRNLYIQWYSSGTKTANEIENAPSLIENGNNAQFENCSFQFKWELPENGGTEIRCRFGLLISMSSSNLKFNNCAFVGTITFIPVQKASVEFWGFFMRWGKGTISNSYEDIIYYMPPSVEVDHNEVIPNIDNEFYNHNNHMYYADGKWPVGQRLPDDLANKLGSAVWMWVEKDSFFIKHPVPFKQCGIHWNEGEVALPQILAPAQRATNKYMEDGRIIIQQNNTYYDIFGREL